MLQFDGQVGAAEPAGLHGDRTADQLQQGARHSSEAGADPLSTDRDRMRAAQQMEAAFGFYMQRGQSAASVERLTFVQAQPQDSSAPRASKAARSDQVISQRLPSGSAMNAERPPQDRSVASATAATPAATAAAKTVSTSSRVLTVQASVTPDHPVGS
jgi:hypothetical protein